MNAKTEDKTVDLSVGAELAQQLAAFQIAAQTPKTVVPGLSITARKRIVADKLLALAAEFVESFDVEGVSKEDARAWTGAWMNYFPVTEWNDALGERTRAGRRS